MAREATRVFKAQGKGHLIVIGSLRCKRDRPSSPWPSTTDALTHRKPWADKSRSRMTGLAAARG